MTLYEIATVVIGVISLIISIISTISILLLYKQHKLEVKNYNATREENIREKTVSVIHTWSSELKKQYRLVEDLICMLNETECEKIYSFTKFDVDKAKFKKILQICFLDNSDRIDEEYIKKSKKENNQYEVNEFTLIELRWYITSYLNSLEVVAISWQQGLVDRNVLIEQFSFLVTNGRNAMEKYRKIAGNGNSYPALEAFCKDITNQLASKQNCMQPKSELRESI